MSICARSELTKNCNTRTRQSRQRTHSGEVQEQRHAERANTTEQPTVHHQHAEHEHEPNARDQFQGKSCENSNSRKSQASPAATRNSHSKTCLGTTKYSGTLFSSDADPSGNCCHMCVHAQGVCHMRCHDGQPLSHFAFAIWVNFV